MRLFILIQQNQYWFYDSIDSLYIIKSKVKSYADVANPRKNSCQQESSGHDDGLRALAKSRQKMSYTATHPYRDQRLQNAGFIVSPTQPDTLGDGNCLVHAIKDQLR